MRKMQCLMRVVLPKFGSVQFFSKICEPRTWPKFSSAFKPEPQTEPMWTHSKRVAQINFYTKACQNVLWATPGCPRFHYRRSSFNSNFIPVILGIKLFLHTVHALAVQGGHHTLSYITLYYHLFLLEYKLARSPNMISQGTPCLKLLFTFLTFILLITCPLCMPEPPASYLPYILSADTYSFPPYAIAWQILLIFCYLRNFPPLRCCHISVWRLRWAHFVYFILFSLLTST